MPSCGGPGGGSPVRQPSPKRIRAAGAAPVRALAPSISVEVPRCVVRASTPALRPALQPVRASAANARGCDEPVPELVPRIEDDEDGPVPVPARHARAPKRRASPAKAVSTPTARQQSLQNLLFGTAASAAPLSESEVEAIRDQIQREHRKPRAPRGSKRGKSAKEKADAELDSEVDAIIPLLPTEVVLSMLDGERGCMQLPPSARLQHVRRRLSSGVGRSGERLARVRMLLAKIRSYAATQLRLESDARDAACFPMTTALAHEIINLEHVQALARGRGSKGGRSKGNSVREDFHLAATVLGWPIDVSEASLKAAAPRPETGMNTKAGTCPLAAKCQLEWFAAGNVPTEFTTPDGEALALSTIVRQICQFYSRSLLAAGIDQGIRLGEGVSVSMSVDDEEPEDVMRGVAALGKDGAPIEICAPAEGFLGHYDWWPEHLKEMHAFGQVFPEWQRPHGSKGSILKAGPLSAFVQDSDRVRKAFRDLLSLPPLCYTEAEIDQMNLNGHTMHASAPEWSRCIGEFPSLVGPDGEPLSLPESLAKGFNDSDADTLGNWLRDSGAKQEATAAEAAAAAPAGQARRAAAVAALPGRRAQKGAMRVYYGQGGALGNRFGHRFKLLSARQRLVHTVRAVLVGRDWRRLPRGQADLKLLKSRIAPDPPAEGA